MPLCLVVLAQEFLPVIVAVRCANHGVDVPPVWHFGQALDADRQLVVELNQDHRTVDAVVKDRLGT